MVSIIIPNYNGKHFLKNCIESLKKQTYKDIEIIVIDNHSSDGSVQCIDECYPEVEVIELDTNTGFSNAVNVGIKNALGEFVFLLNNDTQVDERCIEYLVESINSSEDIFAVNSKMIQYYNRELIDDAGDEYNAFGWAFKRGYNRKVASKTKPARVLTTCAGASLYRRSVFDEIGYFDNEFFAYLEDVDIGYRANLLGNKNIYNPNALVYHIISGTTGNKKTEFKTKLSARNNIYVIYKNMPFLQILINLPFLLLGTIIKAMFFSRHGFGRVYIKETLAAIKNISKVSKVPFKIKNLHNYIWIQVRLWWNCVYFIYNRIK